MLEQIARVLFWLGLGEILTKMLSLPVPSAVLGLALLYAELSVRGEVPPELEKLADKLLQLLGLLFVPAGVGVIAHLDVFRGEALPILAAVIGGTAVTICTTALVVNHVARSRRRNRPGRFDAPTEARSRVRS
ncbi:CidA/LrgA family protein [Bradyrhizobium guangdongense]|uniref:CidA/LrgA family protein n=1 Tax=Bradyrhizobium guangdongense TaxID=1325090 RepID=A0A410V3R6_9BRAD|nr:CidA/LrgA family protein [Bradyrhizobium guangdongense]QAU38361.1 CidA/LrgA family protein [Bradyrhizobium guangdongense]QOZ59416.1 CidA/LrgA family protein [Bradyrhizobium guangdongense]GGI32904.1 murein hydrolase transporter LrgA [Bradyrhizobium guangdongense]